MPRRKDDLSSARGDAPVSSADTLPASDSTPISADRDDTLEVRAGAPRSDGEGVDDSGLVAGPDDYELGERLGSGGMGEVYKAWDRRLGRVVALKLLNDSGPSVAQALLREARMQARVDHPNVCRVYGVGKLNGRLFIALQYIEGGATLTRVAPKMSREERVRVVAQVADALHAAHRIGLVHRDVKPDNILIQESEGAYKPYVADFGLAREVDAPGMTRAGSVKGTPQYMAPEQVRGDTQRTDRRTDVHALGIILYEVLTGRRRYEGDMVAIMNSILTEEPVALRRIDPSIPSDLEIITLKCLEKDPDHRYDSARAVAEDLRAWLDGEPIRARRASWTYRARKGVRRHPALTSAIAVALLAALALGGYALEAERAGREQARLAQEFGAEVAQNDAFYRIAALLPLHDVRTERRRVEASLAELEQRLSKLPREAEGPGRYARGRGYLTLDRPDDARRELERAASLGYRTPELSYALGLAYTEIYRRALQQIDRSQDEERRAALRKGLEERLREPALVHLKRAAGVRIEAPEYLEGLIALNERRWEEALAKAKAAQQAAPWLFEAFALEGDILIDQAKANEDKDYALALRDLEQAGQAYHSSAEIGRSAVGALRGECDRLTVVAEMRQRHQESPEAASGAAQAACAKVRRALPDDGVAWAEEARSLNALASYRAEHGQDARSVWQEVMELDDRALRSAPGDALVLTGVSYTRRHYADFLARRGEDPRPTLKGAISAAEDLLRLDPHSFEALQQQSLTWASQADWESDHGVDAAASYERAIEAARRAQPFGPDAYSANSELGFAFLGRGQWKVQRGVDPTSDLEAAIAAFEKANPRLVSNDLCSAAGTLVVHQIEADAPQPAFERAWQACRRAAEQSPNLAKSKDHLVLLSAMEADWRLDHSRPVEQLIEEGRRWAKLALAIDPQDESVLGSLGRVELAAAVDAIAHHRNPEAALAAAREALTRSAQLKRSANTLATLAAVYRRWAEWKASVHQSPEAEVEAGRAWVRQALAIDPNLGYAEFYDAVLLFVRANASTGSVRAQELAQSREKLQRAQRMDPELDDQVKEYLELLDK
jgi:serine/threonine-protein kinase